MKGKSPIMAQMEKVFRHTRANSFGTRARYESSCRNFIEFLDNRFKMKNLRNLSDKHLAAYIEHRQLEGVAPKTLKNDLGAIRYMHDMLPNVRYELSDNKDLKEIFSISLDKTPVIKGNRAWTQQEYQNMKKLTSEVIQRRNKGFETARDVRDVGTLCRAMGFRITEAVAMTRSQAEQALRTNVYQVKGEAKNGKWRQVPLSKEAKKVLERKLLETHRGERLFIKQDEQTHAAVNRIEKFLYNNRKKFETAYGINLRTWEKYDTVHTNELTFHGLRYGYIQERIQQEMNKGLNFEKAAKIVTQEVGHERTDVIMVYLGGQTQEKD